jgi:hypothetical protein
MAKGSGSIYNRLDKSRRFFGCKLREAAAMCPALAEIGLIWGLWSSFEFSRQEPIQPSQEHTGHEFRRCGFPVDQVGIQIQRCWL